MDNDIEQAYQYIVNLYRPVSITIRQGAGIPSGVTVKAYINSMNLNSWQSRIRYHRLQHDLSADEVAKRLGMKNVIAYMKKYENDRIQYYTSVENYMAVCDAIGISYEDIADEYMLFIASDYDVKLAEAIEISKLNSVQFAKKYNIEYTTLRHSLKRMHKLSINTYEKYKKIFEEFGI